MALTAGEVVRQGFVADGDGRLVVIQSATGSTAPLTDAQLRAAAVQAKDDYQTGECLADQSGGGAVLTFTFASAVQLVVVESKGTALTSRADPFGGTPSATQGFVCDDAVPTYLPVTCTSVKVFAPTGTTVSMSGFRRS